MLILDGIPGRVTVMRTNPAAGLIRFIKLKPILSFDTHRVLITRVGVSKACNYQMQHSLGTVVYVYVFGDRIGSIAINGLAIGGPVSYGAFCNFESGTGMDYALSYFDQNRLANGKPGGQVTDREIEVTIGTTVIRGFLTDMQLNMLNPEFQLAEFTLMIRTIPEVSTNNQGLFGPGGLQGFGQGGAPASFAKGSQIALAGG